MNSVSAAFSSSTFTLSRVNGFFGHFVDQVPFVRNHRPAGAAPRRPKIEQHDLALQLLNLTFFRPSRPPRRPERVAYADLQRRQLRLRGLGQCLFADLGLRESSTAFASIADCLGPRLLGGLFVPVGFLLGFLDAQPKRSNKGPAL